MQVLLVEGVKLGSLTGFSDCILVLHREQPTVWPALDVLPGGIRGVVQEDVAYLLLVLSHLSRRHVLDEDVVASLVDIVRVGPWHERFTVLGWPSTARSILSIHDIRNDNLSLLFLDDEAAVQESLLVLLDVYGRTWPGCAHFDLDGQHPRIHLVPKEPQPVQLVRKHRVARRLLRLVSRIKLAAAAPKLVLAVKQAGIFFQRCAEYMIAVLRKT